MRVKQISNVIPYHSDFFFFFAQAKGFHRHGDVTFYECKCKPNTNMIHSLEYSRLFAMLFTEGDQYDTIHREEESICI